jgi:hypothetical protein
VYYKCVKFHKNPISGLGGVALRHPVFIGHASNLP